MFPYLEHLLISYAHKMPLELFAMLASFIEEVIAPIPSPLVMITTGTLAAVQGYPLYALFFLALAGTFGKTVGALVVYGVANKAERLILESRLAKFFDISLERIESFGARLGNGAWDYVLLTLLRALPLIPSSVVSIGSGILKVPLMPYTVSTIIGTIIRDGFYLYFGYMGLKTLGVFLRESATIESYIQLGAVILIGAILFYLWFRRKQ